ncbi:MAG TPA: cation-transporting P-type ATPase [Dehalococcoidia bacterium]|nr:cation-transporting P-type ATPase [Dehalococcoidia bacterium]
MDKATGGLLDPETVVTAEEARVLEALKASRDGLTSTEAEQRLRRYGPNVLPRPRPPSPAKLFFAQVTHSLALVLWVSAIVALGAGLPQIALAILVIILVNGVFSFWQEYRSSQVVEALERRMPVVARVRRDGVEQRISATHVVPGDILILQRGDRAAADVRLLWGSDLQADYSILTGESEPVRRLPGQAKSVPLTEAPNCLLAGTTVLEGSAEGVVVATGAATAFGRVAALSQRLYIEPSPLQRELAATSRAVVLVAVVFGAIFFAIGAGTAGLDLRDSFVFALGILVAFIPEGLLPTVTLALALGVQRMARAHAVVRRLSSVETLGCTTVICTDKTGTITENEMTVRRLWVEDVRYAVTGRGHNVRGRLRPQRGDAGAMHTLQWLLRCAVLCNNGVPLHRHRHRLVGDPLDEALLVLAAKGGMDPEKERRLWPRQREFPFDPGRRRMSTLHLSPGDGQLVLFCKGAPAETLHCCRYELRDGQALPLGEDRRLTWLQRIESMTAEGLRVLALAYRVGNEHDLHNDRQLVERDLVLLGIVGLDNPLRREVPQAVERCRRAGIRVVMLTGDHSHTALTVARRAGIADSEARVVTGIELDALDDESLRRMLAQEQPAVFARVTPEHKLRLVRAYQALGEVVAVTGDGVNDAPALRAADIGIAMGRRGTDVAREAADMVLLDDNFGTIVRAVEEGRAIYDNIRKFLIYVLTSNVAEALPFVLFVLIGIPLPLTVLQVLLVDLGTDMFPAIALGVDPPAPGIMERRPRPPTERMVTPRLLWRALGALGTSAAGLSLLGYWLVQADLSGNLWGPFIDSGPLYQQATTVTLAGIVACQVANAFACRSDRESAFRVGLLSNRALLAAIGVEVAILALVIGMPPLRGLFELQPIEPRYWPLVAGLSPTFLVIDELRKLLSRLVWGK